ncbi:MAG: sporulation transcription factor Spo0A [Clostridia bacterium]|nr:sporulation transcription factor Spo0A [Clostridia bacterium]
MQKKSVFLLQDTKELNEELKQFFNATAEYEVVGESTDGINALAMISEKKPNFVITEMVLTGYDGICVIEKIKEMNIKTKVVVLSALCSESIITRAIRSGASYFMAKPFSKELLKERIDSICNGVTGDGDAQTNKFRQYSLEEKISKIFINVGIPPHIKGYNFLREGVIMAVNDPEIINNITKKLYPMIGERYKTTASKVERAIRHAIEVAWNRGRIESINGILGVRAYVGSDKPTNGEFIALIADKMLLERN